MSKTIRELADDLGVSKQTIQYHYQRLPANKRQKDQQGRNIIEADAEQLIREKATRSLPPNNHQIDRQRPPKTDKENSVLIADTKGKDTNSRGDRDKRFATKYQQVDRQRPPKTAKENSDLIADMKAEIAYLRADRDKQFAAKDQQIEMLQKLLDQSQQLQLMTEQKLKQLEAPLKESESMVKDQDVVHTEQEKTAPMEQDKPRVRQGFWSRWFESKNNK